MLQPAGPAAREIANLWWGMFAFAALVFFGVVVAWLVAVLRPHRERSEAQEKRIARRWVLFGLLLPSASVALLLAFGIPAGHRLLPLPLDGGEPLRVEVTARQWQWQVRYPGYAAVLVDELRLPAGRPVDVHVGSADVIHSFWIPRLGGKIDAVPGRTNVVRLQADAPGEFRGQCAEFCGRDHALMVLRVEALDAAEFDAWLAGEAR